MYLRLYVDKLPGLAVTMVTKFLNPNLLLLNIPSTLGQHIFPPCEAALCTHTATAHVCRVRIWGLTLELLQAMRRQEQQSALDAFRERGSRQGVKLPTQGGPIGPQAITRATSGGAGGALPTMGQTSGHLTPLAKLPLTGTQPAGLKMGLDGAGANVPASDLASRFKCGPSMSAAGNLALIYAFQGGEG